MADINKLKDKIKSTIYPNGKGAINASDHQAMLLDIADGMAETDTKLTELSAIIGVFEVCKSDKLRAFLKSITIKGLPKDKKLSIWDIKRNVDGLWQVRLVYTDPNNGSYLITYSSATEENAVHYEKTYYLNKRLVSLEVEMAFDWTIFSQGETYYSSREENIINIANYADMHYLQNINFDNIALYDNDVIGNKFFSFFKKIEIYGNTQKKLKPIGFSRNIKGSWIVYWQDQDSNSINMSFKTEERTMLHKMDDDSYIMMGVDWNALPMGDSCNLDIADHNILLSSNCYMNVSAYNKLAGKRILLLGDSISAIKRLNDDGDYKTYSNILEDRYKCQIFNASIPGSRLSRRGALSLSPTSINQAYAALDVVELSRAIVSGNFQYQDAANQWLIDNGKGNMTEQLSILKNLIISLVDYIIIAAGTNDAQWVSIGNEEDDNPEQLYGSINTISSFFSVVFPKIKLYALTPIVRYFTNANDISSWGDKFIFKDGNYLTLAKVVSYIADAWKRNHIPVADMYWSLGINEQNFSEYFPSDDSTHPNYKGLERMSVAIDNFINSTSEYNIDFPIDNPHPVFDILPSSHKNKYVLKNFFKKVRITGVSEDLRISVWYIHRGTQDGNWQIYFLEYDENPDANSGYICTITSSSEQSLLKANLSGDRGAIELLVDWSIFDGFDTMGADNRYSSRFSLECYL